VISGGTRGLTTSDLLQAVRDEFSENDDLPNTTNPDDWARISGKKGERIVLYERSMRHMQQPIVRVAPRRLNALSQVSICKPQNYGY
jgi:hypothetical protein